MTPNDIVNGTAKLYAPKTQYSIYMSPKLVGLPFQHIKSLLKSLSG